MCYAKIGRATTGPLPPAPTRPAEPQAAAVPELRTKRLVLRRFGPGDVDDVFDYARDPEWAEFLLNAVPQPYTRRNAEEFIAGKMRASPEQEPTWAIALDGTVVGAIGLSVDARRDTGELHYGLGRSYWGRGIMPEAVAAVVDWGFRERSLAKISAHADLRNRRSWRVMEKLGMTREGVRLSQGKDVRPGYPRTDDVYYGLLREEWEATSGGPPGLGIEGGHPTGRLSQRRNRLGRPLSLSKSLLPWREKVRMRGSRANTFTLTSILSRQGRGGHETFEGERCFRSPFSPGGRRLG